jgi:hypothetical protein
MAMVGWLLSMHEAETKMITDEKTQNDENQDKNKMST